MYIIFLIPASWQTGDMKNELLLKIRREILSTDFLLLWTETCGRVSRLKLLTEILKSQFPQGEITHLLLGIMLRTPKLRNTKLFSLNCYRIANSIKKCIGYYHLPTSNLQLRGFLSSSCMEDYLVIEFPVYGGEIGPLTLSWFLSLTMQPRYYMYCAVWTY